VRKWLLDAGGVSNLRLENVFPDEETHSREILESILWGSFHIKWEFLPYVSRPLNGKGIE
jgi:hypothetical protein